VVAVSARANAGWPLLIVGMHRSGTTLLARLLQALGLELGSRVDDLAEDTEKVALHEWLMRRAGGSWEYPEPLVHLLGVPRLRQEALEAVRLQAKADDERSTKWGWKDPRTVFALSLWREVYPDLRVAVVRRDGRDVAASLVHRSIREGEADRLALEGPPPSLPLRNLAVKIGKAPFRAVRSWQPDRALELWVEYNAAIDREVAALGGAAIEMRYEQLVTDPLPIVEDLAKVMASSDPVPEAKRALAEVTIESPTSRNELWPSNDALREARPQLLKYGYE
jgi:sulfotransferase family protein